MVRGHWFGGCHAHGFAWAWWDLATSGAANRRTTSVYDDAGRQIATVDQLGNRTTFVYDAVGNRTLYQDALNNRTTFGYDALNREIDRIDPHGQSATFAYDAVGFMISTTNRLALRRDFSFDAVGRQTGATWIDDDGTTVVDRITFTYDAVGNQLTAVNGAGTYTLTYDALNRVSTVAEPFGLSLTFTWDALGRRTKMEDSLGGVTTSTYDVLSQLTKREFGGSGQTPLRIDLTYTVEGQQESITRYSDLAGTTMVARTSYTYDAADRLGNLHHRKGSDSSTIANYTYTYDAHSRLTAETRNGTATTYTYDNTDQLTGDGTATFTYDAEGNRTNTGYSTGTGNRLTSDGTWNYTYDDEGNMTKKVKISNGLTWTYGYDHRNQLIEAQRRTTDGGTLEADGDIQYDAYGNRLIKIVDENGDGDVDYRQRYGLDGWNSAKPSPIGNENWDVWADLNGAYNLKTRYLRGDVVDQLFARIKNNGDAFWYFADHQGSIRDITNNSGVVKDSLTYDGFGNITAETDSSFRGRYAWTGREFDVETDLQYNRARYYDPKIGRWTSQDPLGFEAGDSNLFRYVHNFPTNTFDPSGFQQPQDWRDNPWHAGNETKWVLDKNEVSVKFLKEVKREKEEHNGRVYCNVTYEVLKKSRPYYEEFRKDWKIEPNFFIETLAKANGLIELGRTTYRQGTAQVAIGATLLGFERFGKIGGVEAVLKELREAAMRGGEAALEKWEKTMLGKFVNGLIPYVGWIDTTITIAGIGLMVNGARLWDKGNTLIKEGNELIADLKKGNVGEKNKIWEWRNTYKVDVGKWSPEFKTTYLMIFQPGQQVIMPTMDLTYFEFIRP